MSDSRLASRLREVLKHTQPKPRPELTYEPDVAGWASTSERPDPAAVAESLSGRAQKRARGGQAIVVEREYDGDAPHGRRRIAAAAEVCRTRLDAFEVLRAAWPGRSGVAGALSGRTDETGEGVAAARMSVSRESLLFVDIETTGLNGGAGMYAFLVGCGFFDGDMFRTRQLFLPTFSDEHRLLSEIADLADRAGTIVTYNGRTFDVPVMELRYLFHRRESPFEELPHLDMLHPARRLWKRRHVESAWHDDPLDGHARSCSLTALERSVLGFSRFNDVPGFEIPGRYFHYLRTGDTRPLEPVLEHNRLDLLSLAVLTAVVLRMVDEGSPAAVDARECLELGHLLERAGQAERAGACFESAVDRADSDEPDVAAEALLALASTRRRQKAHADAADLCARVLSLRCCPGVLTERALHFLAVHHEHRSKDLHQARLFAVQSLHATEPKRRAQVAARLARIDRKLAGRTGLVGGL